VKCSIVIPSYNNKPLIEKCIAAVLRNTDHPDYEIVVVDNHSDDATVSFLKGLGGSIKLILNQENLGFGKACNIGAARADGEVVLFLNNDTEVQPGWLSPLMADLQSPDTGVAGGKLLFADKSIQHAGIVFTFNNQPYNLYRNFPSGYEAANVRRDMKAVTGACMAVKKELFLGFGGFDEGYINGIEDVDLCLKVRARSLKVVYNPQSLAYHYESKSPGRFSHADANINKFLSAWKNIGLWDDYHYYLLDRALPKADPDGVHIILHYTSPQEPVAFFMQVLRQLFLTQSRFRFSVLKPFPDPLLDKLIRVFPGAMEIYDYTGRPFETAFSECVGDVASPYVFHIESDRYFYGNLDLLLARLRSSGDAAIGIPFSDAPVLSGMNSCELAEVKKISHTAVFFNKNILPDQVRPGPGYPAGFFALLNNPKARKFETKNFHTVATANFGV
jgi:GT2 family glycosyltransferase